LTDFRNFFTAIYNNELLRNKNLLNFRLTLNLLPHYFVKLEMLSVQISLYNKVIFNSKLTQNVKSQY